MKCSLNSPQMARTSFHKLIGLVDGLWEVAFIYSSKKLTLPNKYEVALKELNFISNEVKEMEKNYKEMSWENAMKELYHLNINFKDLELYIKMINNCEYDKAKNELEKISSELHNRLNIF